MAATRITSYEQARAVLKTARSAANGKPLNNKYYRLYEGSGCYEIKYGPFYNRRETTLCRIYPDNTLEFTATPEEVHEHCYSFSQMVGKLTPFQFWRIATGRYRVGIQYHESWAEARRRTYEELPHSKGIGSEYWTAKYRHRTAIIKEQPEYFQGIRFNLETEKCINPRPDRVEVRNIDKEKRKEWLAAKRKLERELKVRVRMGVLEAVIESGIEMEGRVAWPCINEKRVAVSSALKSDVLTNVHLQDLVWAFCHRLLRHNYHGYGPDRIAEITRDQTIALLKSQSVYFRDKFGVFKDEQA